MCSCLDLVRLLYNRSFLICTPSNAFISKWIVNPCNKVTPNSKTSKAAKEEPAVSTPPENKTSASAAASAAAAESAAPEVENVTFDAVAEEPADVEDDVSDVVDTIKNGNNVVAFFCKYRNYYFVHTHS